METEEYCFYNSKNERIPEKGAFCSSYWNYKETPFKLRDSNDTVIGCNKDHLYMPSSVIWSELPKIILASVIILGILYNSWFYGIK